MYRSRLDKIVYVLRSITFSANVVHDYFTAQGHKYAKRELSAALLKNK